MKRFFSVSDNSFYIEDTLKTYKLAGIPLPADLVKITDDEYDEFMISPDGKIPGYDTEAKCMVWIDAPPPSEEEQRAIFEADKAALMRSATAVIQPLQDAVNLGEATDNESELLLEWTRYRIKLNRLEFGDEWPPQPAG